MEHTLATNHATATFIPQTNGTVIVRQHINNRQNNVYSRTVRTMTVDEARAEYARLTKLGWYRW